MGGDKNSARPPSLLGIIASVRRDLGGHGMGKDEAFQPHRFRVGYPQIRGGRS